MAWPEMLVPIPGTISLITSIIRIPIVPDSLKGVPVKHVGDVAVVNTRPRSIVVGRVVPDISPVDVVAVVIEEKIVRNTYRHVKAQFGRQDEDRRCFRHHRLVGGRIGGVRVGIHRRRCRGNHPGKADVESDPGRADA
jgi:hypothetical protein